MGASHECAREIAEQTAARAIRSRVDGHALHVQRESLSGRQRKELDLKTSWRRFTLPEEDREPWNRRPIHRWFRSPNVIDLWHYRSLFEIDHIKVRISWFPPGWIT
jgi:hypothetical protein